MLSQWLWIMLCYTEPVVVIRCVKLSNWLRFMVSYAEPVVVNHIYYAEPVVVNHVVLFWTSGCES
jgi:hypothetical protein